MTTRVALLAAILLVSLASGAGAGTNVHGIVQDDAYQPVNGGDVWLERQWGNDWIIAPCCEHHPMQGHAFAWDVPQPGTYRVQWEKHGYEAVWIRYDEFTLPDGAPFGDIQINVKRVAIAPTATPTLTPPPVPTTLMPPTVNPTATPSGWRRPYGVISWFGTWSYGTDAIRSNAVGFLQLSETWQWNVIEAARQAQGGPLGYLLDVQHDPLWLSGADMELGAQVTGRVEVGPYEAMGFCQAIIVRER